jgi:hypothetical protein
MRAIVREDRIIKITEKGNVEIGLLPKVGLERLRWDGERIIDLANLAQIWVRHEGGYFSLHCKEFPKTQLISMTYKDRKALVIRDGLITVDHSILDSAPKILEAKLSRNIIKEFVSDSESLDAHIDNTFPVGERESLKRLYKTVLCLAKKELKWQQSK